MSPYVVTRPDGTWQTTAYTRSWNPAVTTRSAMGHGMVPRQWRRILTWVVLVAIGCTSPPTTGPDWMVGRIVSATGAPVRDIEVASLEATDRTDDSGVFTVRYKDPSRHVHFGHGGVWYQRDYRPEDRGTEVEISLPSLREASLRCGPDPCVMHLSWPLSDGLVAKLTQACEPGLEVAPRQIPSARPDASCTQGSTGPEVPISLEDKGHVLAIGPEKRAVRVEVRAIDGAAPVSCQVVVGDRVAGPAGEGFWSAEVHGTVTASATCDGWPARPERVGEDVGSIHLEWTRGGPVLDLEEVAPWLGSVRLVAEQGESSGWVARLLESSDGTFRLPPLSEGRYRLMGASPSGPEVLVIEPPTPLGTGVLAVVVDSDAETLVGRLDVSGDWVTGAVPVVRVERRP
jgi:hypothetical protein